MTSGVARKFLWSVLTAATAVGVMATAGFLGLRMIRHNWEGFALARAELDSLEQRRAASAAAAQLLKKLEPERAVINESFADPAAPLPFIETIEELGRHFGVAVELAIASGESRTAAAAYLLSAEGSFEGVMSFLKNLELLPFHTSLTAVELREIGTSAKETTKPVLRLGTTIQMVMPPAGGEE